jgi:DUF917 family protein
MMPVSMNFQPIPAPVSKPMVRSTVSGATAVQLGALNSQAAAQHQWEKVYAAAPSLFRGKVPDISEVTVKNQSYYRLRVKGFSNNLDASRFCGEVSSAGYACTVANF